MPQPTNPPHLLSVTLLLGLLGLLTAYQPMPAHQPRPIVSTTSKYGLHLLLDDGRYQWPREQWPEHIQHAAQIAGEGGYLVQLVRIDDLDPAKWQHFMDLCTQYDLTPIIRLATTLDLDNRWWVAPPADANGRYRQAARQYTNFLTALDWPSGPHYVIVGNEPNHGNEWSGQPDPAAYARFLVDVAVALHTADPAARLLNAPLDAYSPHTNHQPFIDGMAYIDAESFMDGMIAAEPDVFHHLDAWASHPYPMGPFSEPPWVQQYGLDYINGAANPNHVEPPPGIYNRGINGYEWELFKLATYGIEDPPVFITETGWRHAETRDPDSPDNGRPLPDAAQMATYIDLALHGNNGRYSGYPQQGWTPWLDDPRVIAVVFFALDGMPSIWGHTNWLQIDQTGNILGTYLSLGDISPGDEWP